MELRLYDTLTREKRPFVPIDPARVRMYVCGPTVYDFAHIGNARPVIVFDVLFRLLRHIYGAEHVAYVRNVTDVDDKINARAAERGISIQELTKTTYENFKADVDALGCLPPTVEPRATEYVRKPDAPTDMIRLIERLVKNGCAYVAEGHVLFHVPSMTDYGKLSNRSLDEMIAGARVEIAPYKKDPMDFVLWKPSKPDLPGWPSARGAARAAPVGISSALRCRPRYLGETFDIHGGGIDLVFPHHENEIAQSRCAFHTAVMANFWMHNGFLQVEGEKMSKCARQLRDHPRLAEGLAGRGHPLCDAADALPAADQLDGCRLARGAEGARSLVRADRRLGARLSLRRRARCAGRRSQHAESLRGPARAALRSGQSEAGGRMPESQRATARAAAGKRRAMGVVPAGLCRD